ncbi:MAG: complex I subunit 1/NuoH family protein, partial [Acidimicrobiales bacterium]
GSIFEWNIVRLGFLPFAIFVVAATAELNRPPFDLVEAEQELVGGFHTEYSSLRFALFFLAEFMNTIVMSAVIVTLFLGGPAGPAPDGGFLGAVVPVGWFLAKMGIFLFTYVWLRATLPRLRYDQLMDLGWKRLIPFSLFWLLVLAAMRIEAPTSSDGWVGTLMRRRYGFMVFAGGVVLALLLLRAIQVGRERTEEELAGPRRLDQFGEVS